MTKSLKILLAEDNESHLADAMATVQRRVREGKELDVTVIRDILGYFSCLDQKKEFDGIISDIFFPTSIEEPHNNLANNLVWDIFGSDYTKRNRNWYRCGDKFREKIYELVVDGWMDGKEIPPSGIILADYAKKNNIPVVFCTDTYHHGYKTQPVYEYAQANGIQLIDCYIDDNDGNAPSKDWKEALDILINKITWIEKLKE